MLFSACLYKSANFAEELVVSHAGGGFLRMPDHRTFYPVSPITLYWLLDSSRAQSLDSAQSKQQSAASGRE